MNKKTIVFCSLLTTLACSAQEVVSTQGDSYSNGSGKIDFTIGEVVINTGTNGTTNLTQGFHQTNWKFLGLADYAPQIEVSVFPNPTSDFLTIQTETVENIRYELYDAQGKCVLQGKLTGTQTSVHVSELATGSYSLNLLNATQLLKSIKLIKQL